MGATFCHLAVLRSAIEFLFWDHWETAILVQILAGRSRELFWDHCETAVAGQILAGRSREVTGGHGRSWEVTVGYGRLRRRKTEESGGTAGKRLEKKREKMKENREKQGENGGTWRNSEAQRWAASVGARNKIVCRGMRSDTEEGGAKGCKARRSLPNVLQMVWASNLVRTGL